MFAGMTSGMMAQAPLAFLVDRYGWRDNILALGIAGFILSFLVFLFVRNQPARRKSPTSEWLPAARNATLDQRSRLSCEMAMYGRSACRRDYVGTDAGDRRALGTP